MAYEEITVRYFSIPGQHNSPKYIEPDFSLCFLRPADSRQALVLNILSLWTPRCSSFSGTRFRTTKEMIALLRTQVFDKIEVGQMILGSSKQIVF